MPLRKARPAPSDSSSLQRGLSFTSSLAPIGAAPSSLKSTSSTSRSILSSWQSKLSLRSFNLSKSSRDKTKSGSKAHSLLDIEWGSCIQSTKYQPLTADERRVRERELARSASSLSLKTDSTGDDPMQDLRRKLDGLACTADEYWQTIELLQTAGESPAEAKARDAWNAEKARDVAEDKAVTPRARSKSGYSSMGGRTGGRQAEGRTWRAMISFDEQMVRDEITRRETFAEVLSLDDLETDEQMRRNGFRVRHPLPVMPFSTLSRSPGTLIRVVPSRGQEFDHAPSLVPSRSSSTASRLPSQLIPTISYATFPSSPELSSAEPTPVTPYTEWVPSASPYKPTRPLSTSSIDHDSDEGELQAEDVSGSQSHPDPHAEEEGGLETVLPEGGQWRLQKHLRQESRNRIQADDSFDTDPADSPAKSIYGGYPDSLLGRYAAASEGASSRKQSPFVDPIHGYSAVSYSSHSPVSEREELSSPSPSVAARYLDKSLSPTPSCIPGHESSPSAYSKSTPTTTSSDNAGDSSLQNGFATLHTATRGIPAVAVLKGNPRPERNPFLTEDMTPEERVGPAMTSRQLHRELSARCGGPLFDSDYSPLSFVAPSEASPTPVGTLHRSSSLTNLATSAHELSFDSQMSIGMEADVEEDSPVRHRVRSHGGERAVFGIAMGKKAFQLEDKTRQPARPVTKLVRKGSKPTIPSPLTRGSGNLSSPTPSSPTPSSPNSSFTPQSTSTPARATTISTQHSRANVENINPFPDSSTTARSGPAWELLEKKYDRRTPDKAGDSPGNTPSDAELGSEAQAMMAQIRKKMGATPRKRVGGGGGMGAVVGPRAMGSSSRRA